jgi:enoyl-CoA hydratase/carnithine racemase
MTGRVFEAEEALKLGLVTRIADVSKRLRGIQSSRVVRSKNLLLLFQRHL